MPPLYYSGGASISPRNRAQDDAGGGGGNSLLTSLVAAWELDEASGTRADSHTNGYDLTDNNTVGTRDGGAEFIRANNEYLTRASNSDLETGDVDWTASIRFVTDALAASTNYFIYAKEENSSAREWRLDIFNGSLRAFLFDSTNGVAASMTSSVSLSTGTEYHCVLWYNASANDFRLRVDDATENSDTHATTLSVKSGAPVVLGGQGDGTSGVAFDGVMKEARFWKRLLTSAEITDLYNSGSGRPYSYFE